MSNRLSQNADFSRINNWKLQITVHTRLEVLFLFELDRTWGVVDGELDPLALDDAAGDDGVEVGPGVAGLGVPPARPEGVDQGRLAHLAVPHHHHPGVVSSNYSHVDWCLTWPITDVVKVISLKCCFR